MAARPYFASESADEVSTTSTSYQNKANPLTFTGVSGTKYLILATARIRFTSTNPGTSGDVALREGTTVRDQRLHGNNVSTEAHQVLLSYVYTGTGSPVTFNVSFKRSGNAGTCYCSRVRIIAIQLNENDLSASGAGSAANNAYEDKLTLTVDPPSSGDYLILAIASVYSSASAAPYCGIKLHDGTNNWGEVNGTNGVKHKTADVDRRHWAACAKVTLSSSTTFRIAIRRIGSSSGTVYLENARIIALRLADLDGHAFAEQRSPRSNADTTWTVNAVTLTHTPPARFGVIIANTNVRSSTGDATWNARAVFPSDTAAEAIGYSRPSPGMWFSHSDLWFGTPQATEQTHKIEIRAGTGTAESDEATIVWLELGTASQTYNEAVTIAGDTTAAAVAAIAMASATVQDGQASAAVSGIATQRALVQIAVDQASTAMVAAQRVATAVPVASDAMLSAASALEAAATAISDAAAALGPSSRHAMQVYAALDGLAAAADAAALMVLRSSLVLGGVATAAPDAATRLRTTLETAAIVAVASLAARHVLACTPQTTTAADLPFIVRALFGAASGLSAQASDAHASRQTAIADAHLGATPSVDGSAKISMQAVLPATADLAAHGAAGMRRGGHLGISSAAVVQSDAVMRGLVSAAITCAAAVDPGAQLGSRAAMAADAAASSEASSRSIMREVAGLSAACATSIVMAHLGVAAISLFSDAAILQAARSLLRNGLTSAVSAGADHALLHHMAAAVGASAASNDALASQLRAVAAHGSAAAADHVASAVAAFRAMLDAIAASTVSSSGGASHAVAASFVASGAVGEVATWIARSVLAAAVDIASVAGAVQRMRSAALLTAELAGLPGNNLRAADGLAFSVAGLLASVGILRAGCAVGMSGHAELDDSALVSMVCVTGAAAAGIVAQSPSMVMPVTAGLAADAVFAVADHLRWIGSVGIDGAALVGASASARMAVVVGSSASVVADPTVVAALRAGIGLDAGADIAHAVAHQLRVDLDVRATSGESVQNSSRTVTALVLGTHAGMAATSAHGVASHVALAFDAILAAERRIRIEVGLTVQGHATATAVQSGLQVAAIVASAVAVLDAIHYLPPANALNIEVRVTSIGGLAGQHSGTRIREVAAGAEMRTFTGQMRVYEIGV